MLELPAAVERDLMGPRRSIIEHSVRGFRTIARSWHSLQSIRTICEQARALLDAHAVGRATTSTGIVAGIPLNLVAELAAMLAEINRLANEPVCGRQALFDGRFEIRTRVVPVAGGNEAPRLVKLAACTQFRGDGLAAVPLRIAEGSAWIRGRAVRIARGGRVRYSDERVRLRLRIDEELASGVHELKLVASGGLRLIVDPGLAIAEVAGEDQATWGEQQARLGPFHHMRLPRLDCAGLRLPAPEALRSGLSFAKDRPGSLRFALRRAARRVETIALALTSLQEEITAGLFRLGEQGRVGTIRLAS